MCLLLLDAAAPAAEPTRIYFSALDKSEKPVSGLRAADFELKVNGKAAPLAEFRPSLPLDDRSVPLVAWILIDFNPNVQTNVIRQQAQAAADIFRHFHPDSVVGVKLVSDRSETLAPLAHDAAALRSAFNQFGNRRAELRTGGRDDTIIVGPGGILRAIELAMVDLKNYVLSTPALQNRELHRAIMVLSDGNVNPSYKTRPLWEYAASETVFLYPVFMPRTFYGDWIRYYFDLAKKTAGMASVFGALKPGSEILPLPKANTQPNALTFNILHMMRDLNAKYSFTLSTTGAREMKVQLKSRVKDVRIRLPRS
jgi:hypothetical protein